MPLSDSLIHGARLGGSNQPISHLIANLIDPILVRRRHSLDLSLL